jgi:biopolymer transport protein ExbD
LLLIFFMLTARLTQPEPFEVEPPASASTNPVELQEFIVLIGADGRLAVGEQTVDEEGLRNSISAHLSEQKESRVKLKADAKVKAERLLTIMEILRQAGVEKLVLLTALDDA